MEASIREKFEKMGARAKVRRLGPPASRNMQKDQPLWPRLNVLRDGKGEYFDLAVPQSGSIQVVDLQAADRHLLLLARDQKGRKAKFLCGHDERHWFVCAIPESPGVRDVMTARRALQPDAVQREIMKVSVKPERQFRRRNEAYIRQGEWFFVKADIEPPLDRVLRNEPLRRGRRSKPHRVDFLYRVGGTSVVVHNRHAPSGLSDDEFRQLPESIHREPGWTRMARDPVAYVKGCVRHADHKTIVLKSWHRVFLNTEAQSRAASSVVFLD